MKKQSAKHKPITAFRRARDDGQAYRGAASGHFDPGKLAMEVLGEDLNFGELMAYCFRRFGPPNAGSDDFKDLCAWNLTTSMPGVLLTVRIIPHKADLLFCYLLSKDVDRAVSREEMSERQRRRHRWYRWVRKTYGEDPPLWAFSEAMWKMKELPFRYGSPEYKEREAKEKEWHEAYNASGAHREPPSRKELAPKVEQAIRDALADLKRPVYVRDVPINALGRLDHMKSQRGTVGHFKAAGYYVPIEMWDHKEAFSELLTLADLHGGAKGLVAKLGGMKEIDAAFDAAEKIEQNATMRRRPWKWFRSTTVEIRDDKPTVIVHVTRDRPKKLEKHGVLDGVPYVVEATGSTKP